MNNQSSPGVKRAVFVADRLPYPLNTGYRVRTFHIVRNVAARLCTTVVAFHPPEDSGTVADFVGALGGAVEVVTIPPPAKRYTLRQLLLGVISSEPVQVWNTRSAELQNALNRVCAEHAPCAGISICGWMYPYLRSAPGIVHRIIDTQNVDSILAKRYVPHLPLHRKIYGMLSAPKLRQYETRIFNEADAVWVCSQDEAHDLAGRGIESEVRVVPNGLDIANFKADTGQHPVPNRLLFFGQLDYFPNLDAMRFFLREIYPGIRGRNPQVEFRVAGRDGTAELRELCTTTPGVTFVGALDDLRPEIASAAVVVVPLRMGAGTRLKILESLGVGRPVVSTRVGAEGLNLRDGSEIVLADTPGDFTEAVLGLLSNDQRREAIAVAGQAAVERQYDWDAIGQLLAPGLPAQSGR